MNGTADPDNNAKVRVQNDAMGGSPCDATYGLKWAGYANNGQRNAWDVDDCGKMEFYGQ
jgi:hypothetical protein